MASTNWPSELSCQPASREVPIPFQCSNRDFQTARCASPPARVAGCPSRGAQDTFTTRLRRDDDPPAEGAYGGQD